MDTTPLRPLAAVTGGSNGIGYALAKVFIAHGYGVLIAAEDEAHLAAAAQGLRTGGATTWTHASDLFTKAGVESLYDALNALHRPVNVLCVMPG